MWLGYLLLIAPLTQGASVKLTKRKLSDPLLARPHTRRQHIPDIVAEQKRSEGMKRMVPVPEASDGPSQPGGQEVITKYVTEQVTVYVQPSGAGSPSITQSGGAQVPVSASGGSGGTVYTTVKVYVTVDPPGATATSATRGTASLPSHVAALEAGQAGTTSLGQVGGVPISLSSSTTSAAVFAISQSGAAVPSSTTAGSSLGVPSNAASLASKTTGVPSASRTAGAIEPIATNVGIEPVDPWVYTIDVKLGPDGKVVPLLVDTGSFSFWAAADSCSICTTNGMVGGLQSDRDRCTKYDASYGTGHFSGCLVNTTMEFGPYKLDNMAMAAAVDLGEDLAAHGASFSGMFGLALPGREGTTTPMSRLFGDGLVDDPWVGMRLYRQGEGDSEMIFGDALTSSHGDPAFRVELPQRSGGGFKYNVTLDSLTILGIPVTDSHINNRGVVLDTGTSNIIVPEARYKAILAHLSEGNQTKAHPTTGNPMLRCKATIGQSALVFKFGGVDFAVPWKDVVGPKIDLTGTVYDAPSSPEYCEPRIQTIGDNNWILGDSFLVNVYHAINTQTGAVQLWRLKS